MSALSRLVRRIAGTAEAVPPRQPPAPRPAPRPPASAPRSSFDAAKTGDENRAHWAAADALGPNAALSPDVRERLRNRSRYETQNNGYAGGLVEGRANDTVGTGPRLQLTLPETWVDPDFGTSMATPAGAAREVELKFLDWAEAVGLTDDLILMDETETRDGEVFAVAFTNPALAPDGRSPQLDVALYEAEQCANPFATPAEPLLIDGIRFDRFGNPVLYYFLRRHPGEQWLWAAGAPEPDGQFYDQIPAGRVFHLFKRRRPKASRGLPALTAGLPLYAILRRYTLASLGAAELAAMIAGVIETDAGSVDPDQAAGPEFEEMDKVPFARNALLTLPPGAKAHAFKSEQPAPSHREFRADILTEAGRGVNAPRNVSTGSSAEYNYSSGRLDRLPHQQATRVRRDRLRRVVLDPLTRMWFAEARAIPGYLPDGLPPAALWRWGWRWDGFGSIDPVKDATANEIALRSGQTTLERVCGESGEDWEEVLEQQAREARKRAQLGLPPLATGTGSPGAAEPTAAPEQQPGVPANA
jgi:lambda family phage portal protein